MNQYRKLLNKDNPYSHNKDNRKSTTIILEKRSQRINPLKVEEQKVIAQKAPLSNRSMEISKSNRRISAIPSLRKHNDIFNKTSSNELDKSLKKEKEQMSSNTSRSSASYNLRSNNVEQKVEKEEIKWKKYVRNKEEKKPLENNSIYYSICNKPVKEEKVVKENTNVNNTAFKSTIIEGNKNKPKEKVVTVISRYEYKDNKNDKIEKNNIEKNKNTPKENLVKTEVVTVKSNYQNKDSKTDKVEKTNLDKNKSTSKEREVKTEVVTVKSRYENIFILLSNLLIFEKYKK